MANNYFEPGRMESQYVETSILSVMFQSAGANASVSNGTLAVLGDFYTEPVYTSAYGATTADLNTRVATLPTAATDKGVGIIEVVDVPSVSGANNTNYRVGSIYQFGITAPAGTPVAFRKLKLDDTFKINSDNTTAALTAGQYAIVDTTGKVAPSATIPASGLTCKVISKKTVSAGVTANTTQYFLLVVQVA